MSQGAWQDWDDIDYIDYLERYYGMQLTLARTIVKDAMIDDFGALTIAVFNKIASPSVYLQPHFKAHMAKKNNANLKAIPVRDEVTTVEGNKVYSPRGLEKPIPTPQPDKWKPTRTPGTLMCSERDVTDEELADAKANKDGMMWYIPPGDGYRWGLVFKKVKA